jgi:transcriptional antiterminator NusG
MEDTEKNSHWYVLRSISGQEKKVKQYLESEIRRQGWESQVLQILIPTEKIFEVKNGKKKTRERSYLPGYIFIEFTDKAITTVAEEENTKKKKTKEVEDVIQKTVNSEIIQIFRDVPGVVGFLGAEKGKHPIPLRESEINKILGKVDELKDQGEIIENPFIIGETVKIVDGAFNGFEAQVEEVNEEKKKLKVMVKIFGRNNLIELGFLQVEKMA